MSLQISQDRLSHLREEFFRKHELCQMLRGGNNFLALVELIDRSFHLLYESSELTPCFYDERCFQGPDKEVFLTALVEEYRTLGLIASYCDLENWIISSARVVGMIHCRALCEKVFELRKELGKGVSCLESLKKIERLILKIAPLSPSSEEKELLIHSCQEQLAEPFFDDQEVIHPTFEKISNQLQIHQLLLQIELEELEVTELVKSTTRCYDRSFFEESAKKTQDLIQKKLEEISLLKKQREEKLSYIRPLAEVFAYMKETLSQTQDHLFSDSLYYHCFYGLIKEILSTYQVALRCKLLASIRNFKYIQYVVDTYFPKEEVSYLQIKDTLLRLRCEKIADIKAVHNSIDLSHTHKENGSPNDGDSESEDLHVLDHIEEAIRTISTKPDAALKSLTEVYKQIKEHKDLASLLRKILETFSSSGEGLPTHLVFEITHDLLKIKQILTTRLYEKEGSDSSNEEIALSLRSLVLG